MDTDQDHRDVATPLEPIERLAAAYACTHSLHGSFYDPSHLDPLMTAPNVPPTIPPNFVPTNNESIDLKTGIVTEAGTGIQMSEDQYAQAMVNAHEAHDVNEARVKMGLPQLPTLPASPDGAGAPTFSVPSAVVAPPAILPIPHPAAAPEVHASFWASLAAFFKHAAAATGHGLTNPTVLAIGAQIVAIKSPAAGAILTEVAQAELAVQTPPTPPG